MTIDSAGLRETLSALVAINSVNPTLVDGAPGESEIARWVGSRLSEMGADVTSLETAPGRVSVVGRIPGRTTGPSVMLYAHMDTVGVEGMEHPFDAVQRDGRLYGRGAYDMKGGLAACLAAADSLAGVRHAPQGDVYVAAVADEEVASIGMQDVLRHVQPDAAIVTEPTELEIGLAHKGFCWIEVVTRGRAAHGSRYDLGIDANLHMGRVLGALDALRSVLQESRGHPLLGPPSLHAAVMNGGTGPSTYADRCRLEIERRTVPGETEGQVLGEIQGILEGLAQGDPTFQATAETLLWRDPFEVSPDAAVVRAVDRAAARVLGARPKRSGQTPWMDAAFLQGAGVETVVIGPKGAGAHGHEEWVDLASVEALAAILVEAVGEFGNTPDGRARR